MTEVEIALAEELLTQGMNYWLAFQQRKTAGTLTVADLQAASVKLDVDLDQLEADIKAQAALQPDGS